MEHIIVVSGLGSAVIAMILLILLLVLQFQRAEIFNLPQVQTFRKNLMALSWLFTGLSGIGLGILLIFY